MHSALALDGGGYKPAQSRRSRNPVCVPIARGTEHLRLSASVSVPYGGRWFESIFSSGESTENPTFLGQSMKGLD